MQTAEGYVTAEDGVRLFFQKLGDGEKAVIIPNGIYLRDDFGRLADGRTLIFYDVRNRGYSDSVSDPARLARGIQQDIDDLDAVRRYFGIPQIDVIGHSYIGLMVALYAMKVPGHVNRVVQIGPMQPKAGKQYPAHLPGTNGTLAEVSSQLAQLQKERESYDPIEFCKRFWAILGKIYVTDPADAARIDWGRCDLPNERNFMKYWQESIYPSIQKLNLTEEESAKAQAPVLTVHGVQDRSAPYGGGREWASMLPNARLLTVPNGGHAPWIEAPQQVFGAIEVFLNGAWPEDAESP